MGKGKVWRNFILVDLLRFNLEGERFFFYVFVCLFFFWWDILKGIGERGRRLLVGEGVVVYLMVVKLESEGGREEGGELKWDYFYL